MSEKLNYENNIKMIKNSIKELDVNKADEIISIVFYENANELFVEKKLANNFLGDAFEEGKQTAKKPKNKALKIIIPVVIGVGALILIFKNKTKKLNKKPLNIGSNSYDICLNFLIMADKILATS